ncbi:ABC-three component system protein [Pseudomonas juntendi]|uniref:ABC-three component system protein n=1 Tax=Pseudomonas juntendi TaxID=2666183 RepID=UPI003B93F9CD
MSTEEKDENLPATAITTWSGYVYQGKIALYHSLKLINEGDDDFELQLDSSDDFAIYKNNALVSAHQVKAKISKYRSEYEEALEKSSVIEFDRIKGVSRYFHVSVPLTDTANHTGKVSGELVEFYTYGDNKYCGLGEIEALTKDIIRQICTNKSVLLSEKLLHYNYCVLSEKISTEAIAIHRLVQVDREKAVQAAYEARITAISLLDDILQLNPHNDTEYFAVELRADLYNHLEQRLDQALPGMSDEAYGRARSLFEHIQDAPVEDLITLCQLMKPSVKFSKIQKNDIRQYSRLIEAMAVKPILNQFPHYLDKQKTFYLPTALDLPSIDDHEDCITDLLAEMGNNDDLLKLLFEYNHLIPSRSTESFVIDTKFSHPDDLNDPAVKSRIDSNIIKSFCLSIVTKTEAEARLNDK